MAKKKIKEFKPGDKVIWFSTYQSVNGREPVIAWVTQEKWYPCVVGSRVRVTRHERDALVGLGRLDPIEFVYPWDDGLWAACQWWLDNKADMLSQLKRLQKGRL